MTFMKIAFVTYEYPPETADGGIATYARQAVRMLVARGHHVEVFAGSRNAEADIEQDGALIHRIRVDGRRKFADQVVNAVTSRHAAMRFDVLEGPDFMADAHRVAHSIPELPSVVKLHTPMFIVQSIEYQTRSVGSRLRALVRAKGKVRRLPWHPLHPNHAVERLHLLGADEIASPSRAIANWVTRAWNLDYSKISCFPCPFVPAPELLKVPLHTDTRTVTFLGRLEYRKGVLDLAAAIPLILRRNPDVIFRFIGRPMDSPAWPIPMDEFLRRQLRRWERSVQILPPVPTDELAAVFGSTDICVFPSIWESFGLVALESMSAGRGIVCSSGSGLEELVDGGRAGLLVPPRSPRQLARAVCKLLADPCGRMKMGEFARKHVLETFGWNRIGPLQEASYAKAIERNAVTHPKVKAAGRE